MKQKVQVSSHKIVNNCMQKSHSDLISKCSLIKKHLIKRYFSMFCIFCLVSVRQSIRVWCDRGVHHRQNLSNDSLMVRLLLSRATKALSVGTLIEGRACGSLRTHDERLSLGTRGRKM